MNDSWCIWIISPPGYEHAGAFYETARGLQGGFRELGLQVPIVTQRDQLRGRAIILGANLLPGMPGIKVPPKAILFNLEQITPGSDWLSPAYLKLLKRHTVWDYSTYNIEQLAILGIDNVAHCPLGFSDPMHCMTPADDRDIDILFYGSINERRLAMLEHMATAGLKIEVLFGVYGDERDAMIARSRIVLNVHYYPAKIFEIVRISHLLANGVCVVSEDSPMDSALEAVQDGIVQAPYDGLVDCCRELIDTGAWQHIGRRGHAVFSTIRQADYLRAVLNPREHARKLA